jgi:biofilm protein TabA
MPAFVITSAWQARKKTARESFQDEDESLYCPRFPASRFRQKANHMIFDRIENQSLYPFGSAWKAAFDFLKTAGPEMEDEKYLIQGDDLFAGVNSYQTKPRDIAKLETHRKYVDIQVLLSGEEIIEVFEKQGLTVSSPYNPEKDAEFYHVPAKPCATITLKPGQFAVFFPEDAHMPSVMTGSSPQPVKKVVIKVAVELLP